MKYTVFPIITILFSLYSYSGMSQNLWNVKFERITTDDGLSQGMVNSILQDKYGFMWFASNDGLNRYDGNNFTVFKNDPNDNNSIADNFIRYLFEDSKGRIWIATAGNGLDLFDRQTETFIHFKHSPGKLNSISDNSITSIDEDQLGGIWIGTLQGLNRLIIKSKAISHKPSRDATESFLNNHTISFTKIKLDTTDPGIELYSKNPQFPLADWRASNFHIDSQGFVWVSAQERLFRIQPIADGTYRLLNLPVESYLPIPQNIDDYQKYVQDFVPGVSPGVFYMLFQDGLTQVDSESGKVQVISKNHLSKGAYAFPSVQDNAGLIWISDETVLGCFNTSNNSWIRISSSDKNIEPVLSFISCSYKDKMGNIWLGTKGYGLLKYNPLKNNFNKTENQYIRYMSAGKDEKVQFVKDPYDELFWEFDLSTNSIKIPVPFSAFPKHKFPHFGNYTSSVLQDKDGSYWIGRKGLYHYDPVTKKASEYWNNYDNVFPLYDDNRNNLWFGNTLGLVQFNKLAKTSVEYPFPSKSTMGPYDYLQAIYRDNKGILWLGTLGGLYRFDPEIISWKQYKNIKGNKASLSNNLIFSICPDPKQPEKYLWIGTKGGGLNLFDQESGTFISYTEKEGLSNDVVYGILGDASGNIWLSSNKGISQFDTRTKQFKNYNVNDGLQGSEYNRNAFAKTESGHLYFGGITGFNYFDPSRLTISNYVPFVWITGINVLNKSLNFQEPDGILTAPPYLTKSIELKYEQNIISFEFASTDYSAVNNNRYQYQLAGFDKTWIETGGSNTATFTNLDPGTYELRVKGTNSNGIWNEVPTTLKITILPPWYLTWWFRISLLLILLSVFYVFHRYRLKRLIQLQKVRNGIASDLHDEIGSNLSAIAVFSELAGNPNKSGPEVSGLLKKISEYTQTSQDSMSDIVWMIDSKHDRLGALMLRMHTFANEVLESTNIRLIFLSDPSLEEIKLSMQQRKAVYLIFKEAVNNIVKYAEATDVTVNIKRENNLIELSVTDNGIGFTINEQYIKNLKGGNGLENMKQRAKVINGKLSIESTEGSGTTTTLKFSA